MSSVCLHGTSSLPIRMPCQQQTYNRSQACRPVVAGFSRKSASSARDASAGASERTLLRHAAAAAHCNDHNLLRVRVRWRIVCDTSCSRKALPDTWTPLRQQMANAPRRCRFYVQTTRTSVCLTTIHFRVIRNFKVAKTHPLFWFHRDVTHGISW
jgi:hypothetical protein